MDKEQIIELCNLLKNLGLKEGFEYALLSRLRFATDGFVLKQEQQFDGGEIYIQLHFKSDKEDAFVCCFYDVLLKKDGAISHATINGIDTKELEAKMRKIDWALDSSSIHDIPVNVTDDVIWKEHLEVFSIIKAVSELSASENGKEIAEKMKMKYWSKIEDDNITNSISLIKGRYELRQRFYVSGSHTITISEAHKFLNNRWLERQMQQERKSLNLPTEQKPVKPSSKLATDKCIKKLKIS